MADKKSITILSGPVGAGKTTVARALVASMPEQVVYIEGDVFWPFIAKASKNLSRNHNFKMVMTSMAAAAMPFALYGYDVILDFSVPPWFLETALKMAKVRDILIDYVVLRPSEAVCAARAAARPEGTIADYSRYHELYTSFDEVPRHIISEDTASPETVAAKIRDGLDVGIFRVVE